MAYTMDTVVGDILANPEALAIMDFRHPWHFQEPDDEDG